MANLALCQVWYRTQYLGKPHLVCWVWYRQERSHGQQWKGGRRLLLPSQPLNGNIILCGRYSNFCKFSKKLESVLSEYDCSHLLNEVSSSPAGDVLALVLARLAGSLWRRGRGSRGLAGCATCQTHATGNENLHVCLFFCLFGGSCCTQAAHIIAFYLFFDRFRWFVVLLSTWVGVDVKVKTFTMESSTTTILSLRRRTHLT